MPHSSLWLRPAIVVSFVLLITMLLPLDVLPSTAIARTASRSGGALTITTVFTTDGSGKVKSTFAPGDAIQYYARVNNSSGSTITATFHYQAWGPNNNVIYDQIYQHVSTLVGLITYPSPTTVPNNAPPGTYTIQVFVGDENNAQNQDTKQSQFTVTTNTPTVIVQKVFTADSNNNARTAFAPGDPIHYMWEAQNTSSTPVTATVTYLATGPQQIYKWSGSASLASGPLRFYSAPTIPTNAPTGTYTITVTITYNGVSSSGQSQFSVATSTPTWSYDPGNYAGKSSSVSVGDYREPDGSQYYNYCGPGASQVLISAWTANVPSIQTLAAQEQTNRGKVGTYLQDMVQPISNAIGQNYYSIHNANSQGDFSNMIGKDILDNHHPLITGLLTIYGNNHLYGWSYVSAPHIITITGFDFTSPTQGWIYYTETASAGAGATHGPGRYHLDYNTFWSLVQQNNIQLS